MFVTIESKHFEQNPFSHIILKSYHTKNTRRQSKSVSNATNQLRNIKLITLNDLIYRVRFM